MEVILSFFPFRYMQRSFDACDKQTDYLLFNRINHQSCVNWGNKVKRRVGNFQKVNEQLFEQVPKRTIEFHSLSFFFCFFESGK